MQPLQAQHSLAPRVEKEGHVQCAIVETPLGSIEGATRSGDARGCGSGPNTKTRVRILTDGASHEAVLRDGERVDLLLQF